MHRKLVKWDDCWTSTSHYFNCALNLRSLLIWLLSVNTWRISLECLKLYTFPEKLRSQQLNEVVVLLHILISTTTVICPVLVILRCDSAVISGVILMLVACIVLLKLVSYAHTNYDMRALATSFEKGEVLLSDTTYDVSFKSLAMLPVACCSSPSTTSVPIEEHQYILRGIKDMGGSLVSYWHNFRSRCCTCGLNLLWRSPASSGASAISSYYF